MCFLAVLVPERVAASPPTLADVRALVEREFLAERRKVQLENLYHGLLQKYTVPIEMPKEETKQADVSPPRSEPQ